MNTSKVLHVLCGLCSIVMLSNIASAEILVAQTRTSAAIYGGSSYTVDFNGAAAGGTVFSFSTTEPDTRVVITFNAECAVANDAFHWVDIDIVVDPAGPTGATTAPPSNGNNAFCSGNTTDSDFLSGSGGDGWVSASTQATLVLATPGEHTVKVRVNGANSGIARLDDMSLVVMR